MDASHDVSTKRGVNRTMPSDPVHVRKNGCGDGDLPVAFAGTIVAGMSGMAGTVIDDDQLCRRKGGLKCRTYLRFESHFSVSPPSIPARMD